MKNYLLDSNVLIELFRNRNSTIIDHFKALAEQQLFTSSVARAEVIHGAYRSTSVTKNLLIANTMLARINELPFDTDCANQYAALRAELEAGGAVIGSHDIMIAATALVHDLTLVTHNTREFSRIPNLKLEDWELP